jgi:hypothetical protein
VALLRSSPSVVPRRIQQRPLARSAAPAALDESVDRDCPFDMSVVTRGGSAAISLTTDRGTRHSRFAWQQECDGSSWSDTRMSRESHLRGQGESLKKRAFSR